MTEVTVVSSAERPDLPGAGWPNTLPAYNYHGDALNRYWGRLRPERSEFLLWLVEDGAVIARAWTIPVPWDGTVDGLPAGIDGAIERGFEEEGANALCALIAEVVPGSRRRGVSRLALEAMAATARAHGLEALIAPVRPSLKERYPLAPIERYAGWRRDDGLLFDPWMRVHERMGATVLLPEPESMLITGTVVDWEGWTEMAFPESGGYVFPGGLATVAIDRAADRGSYWEPNVWMLHAL